MLPSRLFRNTGIPPPLRSLVIPHASLPPSITVQLRLRLGVMPGSLGAVSGRSRSTAAAYSTTSSPIMGASPSSATASSLSSESSSEGATTTSQALPEKMEPRLSITFTCTAGDCGERSTHQFTKRSYEKGIVIIQCPKCKNRHLIADNLGWFKDSTEEGKLRNVEDILRARGEKVIRGRDTGGVVEYTDS